MKIYNKVVIDMDTLEILEEDSFEYEGPLALCEDEGGDADGPGGDTDAGESDSSEGGDRGGDSDGGGGDQSEDRGGPGAGAAADAQAAEHEAETASTQGGGPSHAPTPATMVTNPAFTGIDPKTGKMSFETDWSNISVGPDLGRARDYEEGIAAGMSPEAAAAAAQAGHDAATAAQTSFDDLHQAFLGLFGKNRAQLAAKDQEKERQGLMDQVGMMQTIDMMAAPHDLAYDRMSQALGFSPKGFMGRGAPTSLADVAPEMAAPTMGPLADVDPQTGLSKGYSVNDPVGKIAALLDQRSVMGMFRSFGVPFGKDLGIDYGKGYGVGKAMGAPNNMASSIGFGTMAANAPMGMFSQAFSAVQDDYAAQMAVEVSINETVNAAIAANPDMTPAEVHQEIADTLGRMGVDISAQQVADYAAGKWGGQPDAPGAPSSDQAVGLMARSRATPEDTGPTAEAAYRAGGNMRGSALQDLLSGYTQPRMDEADDMSFNPYGGGPTPYSPY